MAKHAYIFPGQGSQFSGMGKSLYESSTSAAALFEQANEILGFRISDVMFSGSNEDLQQTNVTQPAIFLHSIVAFKMLNPSRPDMVAGHSLGEFTALVASKALTFENALKLVSIRAEAMQAACKLVPSTMAAVLALDDDKIEIICKLVYQETAEVVVAANFNSPGQIVISGTIKGVEIACEKMKAAGAKRTVLLPVGGAFHSPLMEQAKEKLAIAIEHTQFNIPYCSIYQNVIAKPIIEPSQIKQNLINQLTQPVRWTQTINEMIENGATHFTEVGPGKVLQGLVNKINKNVHAESIS